MYIFSFTVIWRFDDFFLSFNEQAIYPGNKNLFKVSNFWLWTGFCPHGTVEKFLLHSAYWFKHWYQAWTRRSSLQCLLLLLLRITGIPYFYLIQLHCIYPYVYLIQLHCIYPWFKKYLRSRELAKWSVALFHVHVIWCHFVSYTRNLMSLCFIYTLFDVALFHIHVIWCHFETSQKEVIFCATESWSDDVNHQGTELELCRLHIRYIFCPSLLCTC